MRHLWALTALFSFALFLPSCGEEVSSTTTDDSVQSSDGLEPEIPTDPATRTQGKVSCVGIAPPANIQQLQHDQCADWGITECTSTLERCDNNERISTCCCILCGLRQGEPTCFNVRCP